jgi:hypothetical protein
MSNTIEFNEFNKIPRWSRNIVITEKIDGTNASIFIGDNGEFLTGSRTRWITPENDNFGFSKWAHDNKEDLLTLGVGHHFGEWWGSGIQRKYNQDNKRFSLFNISKWNSTRPMCCDVVPVLYCGILDEKAINESIEILRRNGSLAAPGFMNPEGIVIWHVAARQYFKKTIEKDDAPKSVAERILIQRI